MNCIEKNDPVCIFESLILQMYIKMIKVNYKSASKVHQGFFKAAYACIQMSQEFFKNIHFGKNAPRCLIKVKNLTIQVMNYMLHAFECRILQYNHHI
jgi:hypothetical protein